MTETTQPTAGTRNALPLLTLALAALCLLMFGLISVLNGGVLSPDAEYLMTWGGNSSSLSLGTSAWRLLTSTFLHNGILHLIPSLTVLVLSAYFLERRAGLLLSSFVFVFSALSGSTWSALMHDDLLSVGANGAALGMSGALLSLFILGAFPGRRLLPVGVAASVLLLMDLFNPFSIGADLWLDLGGFLSGLTAGVVLGWGAKPTKPKEETPGSNNESKEQVEVNQEAVISSQDEGQPEVVLSEVTLTDAVELVSTDNLEVAETKDEPEPFLPDPLPIEIPKSPSNPA